MRNLPAGEEFCCVTAESGEDLSDRSADFYIQPLLAGNNEASRIESQLMQHSRMNIRHIVPVLHGIVAKLIGRAMRHSALQSTPRHPD